MDRTHLVLVGSGRLAVTYSAELPDHRQPPAPLTEHERLVALRPSRYCPSDRLAGYATDRFGLAVGAPARVTAVYEAGLDPMDFHLSPDRTRRLLVGMGRRPPRTARRPNLIFNLFGGVRVLGVPTVADRIAQTVVAARLEAKVEPIFHPDSYGYRPNRSALDAVEACRSGAGRLGNPQGPQSTNRVTPKNLGCLPRQARLPSRPGEHRQGPGRGGIEAEADIRMISG